MSLRNKVILFGHTGKDVEVTQFEKGIKASVSLATNDYYTNTQGEKIEETQWHNLIVYGKLAEVFEKYVTKGKEIAIEGSLPTEAMKTKTAICAILLKSE